jgi:hypothetical protein
MCFLGNYAGGNEVDFFLWERHLMAAVAFGDGRLPRRADFAKAAFAATAESWLEGTPTRATLQ